MPAKQRRKLLTQQLQKVRLHTEPFLVQGQCFLNSTLRTRRGAGEEADSGGRRSRYPRQPPRGRPGGTQTWPRTNAGQRAQRRRRNPGKSFPTER